MIKFFNQRGGIKGFLFLGREYINDIKWLVSRGRDLYFWLTYQ